MCLQVHQGTTVTFQANAGASFSIHPLHEICGPDVTIIDQTSGTSASFTFNTLGLYGYHCNVHFSVGMVGAINVVP